MNNECKVLECLDRIDNTLCLNNNKGNLEFGIDTEEHIDCDNAISMVEDLETIKQALQRLAQIDNAVNICKKANEQKYVYIKETYGIVKEKFLDDLDYEVLNNRLYVSSRGMYYDFPLKDYGNWWALTREELEKGRSE